MKVFLMVLLLIPQLAAARVYMCVDPATGNTSFTDKACAETAAREEVKVDASNTDSGARSKSRARSKTWNSEREQRKTGVDYNNQRRDLYQNKATASSD